MRIISGKYKAKKIFFTKNFNTRPIKDNVKENIFNILEHSKNINTKIKNASVLDLFAGTGSFGLECISRGASQVLFVENDKNALVNLKKNILNLNIENKAAIYSMNIFEAFKNLNFKKKVNLIFLDPPYKNKNYINILENIKKKDILSDNHTLVFHREKREKIKDISKKIDVVENRIYGRSEILFLKFF